GTVLEKLLRNSTRTMAEPSARLQAGSAASRPAARAAPGNEGRRDMGDSSRGGAHPITTARGRPGQGRDLSRGLRMAAATVTLRRAGSAHGLHILPVTIDGRGPFDFVLDTGAHFPVLDPALADELGLQRAAEIEARGAAGAVTVQTARVGQLAVGGL